MPNPTCLNEPTIEDRWHRIRAMLAQHAALLRKQGSLVSKRAPGRRIWAVRFVERQGGRLVHRSVYIGGDDQPELLDRVRRLLAECRAQGQWCREAAECVRLAALARRVLNRQFQLA